MRDLFPELTNRRNGVAEFGPSLFEMMTDAFFKPMNMNTFKVDVQEDSDKYVVEADLPGFQKENIQVDFENDMLTIQATQNHEVEEKMNMAHIFVKSALQVHLFVVLHLTA